MTSTKDQLEVKDDSNTRVSRSGRVCKKSSKMMYFDSTNGNIKKSKSSKASQPSTSSKKKKPNNIENVDIQNQIQPAKVDQVTNKSQKQNTKQANKDSTIVSSLEKMETEPTDVIQFHDPPVNLDIAKESVEEIKKSSQGNSSINSDSETNTALSNNEIETPDYTSYDEESVNSDEAFFLSKKVTSNPEHEKLQPTTSLTTNRRSTTPQPIVYTGFKVWSAEMKREILRKYRSIDLNVLNVRLEEMWNRLSTVERNKWYTRACFMAQQSRSQNENVMDDKTEAWLSSCNNNLVPFCHLLDDTELRNIELEAIDVAAYLRLLGESLMLIGAIQLKRAAQGKKPAKTSDYITALLDSLVCAMGSLVCLTQQLPLLKTDDTASFKKTLENIAYIMPGL